MAHIEGDLRVRDGARFAILASRWNPRITDALVAGARKAFADNGVAESAVDVIRVPGAWELPLVAARLAAASAHVAVVALGCVIRGDTRHYEQVADGCSEGLMRVALDYGMPVCNGVLAVEAHEDALDVVRVPGAWELPQAAARLAGAGRHAALVALGCVVRGDTRHFEHVADRCAEGLMRVALDSGVPVLNGVLATERFEDAEARAGGSHGNKGEECALAAIEMADLMGRLA